MGADSGVRADFGLADRPQSAGSASEILVTISIHSALLLTCVRGRTFTGHPREPYTSRSPLQGSNTGHRQSYAHRFLVELVRG
jgi:hypothetical protein